jgi:hypothetical protein
MLKDRGAGWYGMHLAAAYHFHFHDCILLVNALEKSAGIRSGMAPRRGAGSSPAGLSARVMRLSRFRRPQGSCLSFVVTQLRTDLDFVVHVYPVPRIGVIPTVNAVRVEATGFNVGHISGVGRVQVLGQ